MALEEYRRKRDFRKTPEPAGNSPAREKATAPLSFVIQEHAARRLHYDFRLDLAGVLKSLAGAKGPEPRPRREAARGSSRGPSARLWRVRRDHPRRTIWRRHRAAVGPRKLGPEGSRPGRGLCQGHAQIRAARREIARQLGPGADGGQGRP